MHFLGQNWIIVCSEEYLSLIAGKSGPDVIKLFSCSIQLSTKFILLIKAKILTNKDVTCLNNTSSVTDMLDHLQWESLEARRCKLQLTMLYKIVNNIVDIDKDLYLTPATTRTRASHSKKYRQISTTRDCFKYSFFPRSIPIWNKLPASTAEAPDLVLFKQGLSNLTF